LQKNQKNGKTKGKIMSIKDYFKAEFYPNIFENCLKSAHDNFKKNGKEEGYLPALLGGPADETEGHFTVKMREILPGGHFQKPKRLQTEMTLFAPDGQQIGESVVYNKGKGIKKMTKMAERWIQQANPEAFSQQRPNPIIPPRSSSSSPS
jgi:hypothetical protein